MRGVLVLSLADRDCQIFRGKGEEITRPHIYLHFEFLNEIGNVIELGNLPEHLDVEVERKLIEVGGD